MSAADYSFRPASGQLYTLFPSAGLWITVVWGSWFERIDSRRRRRCKIKVRWEARLTEKYLVVKEELENSLLLFGESGELLNTGSPQHCCRQMEITWQWKLGNTLNTMKVYYHRWLGFTKIWQKTREKKTFKRSQKHRNHGQLSVNRHHIQLSRLSAIEHTLKSSAPRTRHTQVFHTNIPILP